MQNSTLVCSAANDDEAAWQQLVDQESPRLFRLAYQYVQNSEDAQDIVQEALLRGYTNLAQLQDPAKFGAWLRQIVVNLCRASFRKQAKAQWVPLDSVHQSGVVAYEYTLMNPALESLFVSPDSTYQTIEVREITEQMLATLSKPLRKTVQLYYLQGLSYKEIAVSMDIPMGTVKRRLHDARQQLRERDLKMTNKQKVLMHAVGLETSGESHSPIFNKGTLLPVACTMNFSTATDKQDSIDLHLLQGDSTQMAGCKSLGKVRVEGITSGLPKQTAQIMVTFTIDSGEMLTCKAKELPDKELHVVAKPAKIATRILSV